MTSVTFQVEGDPQGKGRARTFRRGPFVGHYTPEKTRTYEGLIRSAALDAFRDQLPLEVPLQIELRAIFSVPESWSRRRRQSALIGDIKPAKRPDLDNILKAFKDGMNGVIYLDDCQIVASRAEKRYGPAPMVVVTVKAA